MSQNKRKTWSRKGRCQECNVGTGSRHAHLCPHAYEQVYGMGNRITNARKVVELADRRKAVYHVRWGRPVAAAWLASMQLHLIVGFIRMGWLYEYRAKPRKAAKTTRKLSKKA